MSARRNLTAARLRPTVVLRRVARLLACAARCRDGARHDPGPLALWSPFAAPTAPNAAVSSRSEGAKIRPELPRSVKPDRPVTPRLGRSHGSGEKAIVACAATDGSTP